MPSVYLGVLKGYGKHQMEGQCSLRNSIAEYKLIVLPLRVHHLFSSADKEKMSTTSYSDDDSDVIQYLSTADGIDLTYSDSESEYVPSQTSEDRDFVVSDTEQASESPFLSDQSSESEEDVESLCGVSSFFLLKKEF